MINVVYCTDNGYIMPTVVSIKSLIDSNQRSLFSIFVLTNNVDDAGIQLLNELSYEKNCTITVLPIDSQLSNHLRAGNKNNNITTYARLLLEDVLPSYVEKVLYLDGDTLIVDDISELESITFSDELLWGVYDFSLSDYRVKRNIGFNSSDVYINAGVLLINLKAWRYERVSQRCLEMLLTGTKFLLGDQDVINIVCKNRIKLLPIRYNMTGLSAVLPYYCYRFVMEKGLLLHYSEQKLRVFQRKPSIVHYASEIFGKPWQSESYSVYKNKWLEYRGSIRGSIDTLPRVFSDNKLLKIYKKIAEAIIYPFYKRKLYGATALLYMLLYVNPHKIQFLLWRCRNVCY